AKDFQSAISAARNEIQRISKNMRREGWDFAVGTSGSAKSIRDVLAAEMPQEADITYKGMRALAERIIEAGSVKKAKFENLKPERIEVFAGGLAVMMAAFEEMKLDSMTVTEAALRDAIVLTNRERRALANFYRVGQLNPPALSGSDILKVVYGATFRFDKSALIDELNGMADRVRLQWQEG
ncbi:hypothetical protein MM707_32430, partial [Klebsiella pneumoniae]|nr:hypothetical protein [Klebsiella pneumoniae]